MTKIKHDAHVRQYKEREYQKKWYQENRDKRLEYEKKWYQENRDKYLECRKKRYQENRDKRLEYQKKRYQENPEYQKKWYQENRDKRLEYEKKYRQENRDKYLEYQKKWYQENPEYQKKWYQENRDKYLEYHKRYFARLARPLNMKMMELQYCLQAWSKLIKQDNCQICSNPPKEAHHILYKKYYPELMLNENNGIALCQRCHWEVHGKKLDLIKPLEPILDIRRFCGVSVKN